MGGWKTQILDEYGTPTQLRHHGDGPGHFVVCADFDGDGDDEFMLCLFGSLNRDEDGQVLPVRWDYVGYVFTFMQLTVFVD